MIVVDGGSTILQGTGKEVLAGLTCAIKHVRETLAKDNDEETARELIAFAGMLAFMSDDELDADSKTKKQIVKDFIERAREK